MSRIIRKNKLQGQRVGQLIANSMYKEYRHRWMAGVDTEDFHTQLFYLENDELERIVQNFLNDQSWTRPSKIKGKNVKA